MKLQVRKKLGLTKLRQGDLELAQDFLQRMADNKADFTLTFYARGNNKRNNKERKCVMDKRKYVVNGVIHTLKGKPTTSDEAQELLDEARDIAIDNLDDGEWHNGQDIDAEMIQVFEDELGGNLNEYDKWWIEGLEPTEPEFWED